MQLGADPNLAAQCAQVPPPDGWRPWVDATDGVIPEGLDKRRNALVADSGVPLGTTESYPLPGVTTLIRVEPHVWGRDSSGNLTQGCFRTGMVYLPSVGVVTPPVDGWSKAATIMTVASLAVGTIATIASLRGSKK